MLATSKRNPGTNTRARALLSRCLTLTKHLFFIPLQQVRTMWVWNALSVARHRQHGMQSCSVPSQRNVVPSSFASSVFGFDFMCFNAMNVFAQRPGLLHFFFHGPGKLVVGNVVAIRFQWFDAFPRNYKGNSFASVRQRFRT